LNELIAAAALGKEAKDFKASDLYRCMVGFAEQEVMIAQEALSSADPEDPKTIRALQNDIRLYSAFKNWLDELIDNGEAALTAFDQQQRTD
jgi:hypothetical protein